MTTGSAFATDYAFTKIASIGSSGTIYNPSINSAGVVAFAGNSPLGLGVFTGTGGTLTPIALSTSPFFDSFVGDVTINDSGAVAFWSALSNGQSGIFTATSTAAYQTIAMTSVGGFTSLDDDPSINNAGKVALSAYSSGTGVTTIYTGSGGSLTPLASTAGGTFNGVFFPSLTNSGVTGLQASFSDSLIHTAIYTSSGGGLTPIVESGEQFLSFRFHALNDSGVAVFTGNLPNGDLGIYTSTGGAATLVVSDSGRFGGFNDRISINNLGTVAFSGSDDGATYAALYIGGENGKVIGIGDSLFGSTVTEFTLGNHGLNDSGQLAFYYELANGQMGIARASPVPEPGSLALAAIGLGIFGLARLRCRRSGESLLW